MVDKDEKSSYDEGHRQRASGGQPESGERFHFWLIAVALAMFIFLLFYSQKIHGTM